MGTRSIHIFLQSTHTTLWHSSRTLSHLFAATSQSIFKTRTWKFWSDNFLYWETFMQLSLRTNTLMMPVLCKNVASQHGVEQTTFNNYSSLFFKELKALHPLLNTQIFDSENWKQTHCTQCVCSQFSVLSFLYRKLRTDTLSVTDLSTYSAYTLALRQPCQKTASITGISSSEVN